MEEEREYVLLDETKIHIRFCKPFEFKAIYSTQNLSGIELKLKNLKNTEQEFIENLCNKDIITVKDPFACRKYDASIFQKSTSFQVGIDEKSYVIEVKELETPPHIDQLEINGEVFDVVKYEEEFSTNIIKRHALLKLSEKQFLMFRNMLSDTSVNIRRIGLDEDPIELRIGGQMFWSSHDRDDKAYYKHIVSLFPLDHKPNINVGIASAVSHNISAQILLELKAKFDLLVKHLEQDKLITKKTKDMLSDSKWKEYVGKDYLSQLIDSFDKVSDAESFF